MVNQLVLEVYEMVILELPLYEFAEFAELVELVSCPAASILPSARLLTPLSDPRSFKSYMKHKPTSAGRRGCTS